MNRIKPFGMLVAVMLLVASFANAQTALTSTTITEPVTTTDARTIVVSSATGFTAGTTVAYVDNELMHVRAVSGTTISVIRGYSGTRATKHVDNSQIYVGSPEYFTNYERTGACTRGDENALPKIDIRNGTAYNCYGGKWRRLSRNFFGSAPTYPVGNALFGLGAPDAVVFDEDFVNEVAAADAIPNWSTTLVEAGAGGESTVTIVDGDAGELLLTTDNADNDGINIQKTVENFKFSTSQSLTYFGIRIKISDATQSDFLVGLCITDTTLLGGMTDGVYFEKLDAATSISAVTEKDSTETQTDSLHTVVAATYVVLEFLYNGTNVEFYIDGVLKATHTANIPDDELLTPSIHFLTGEAAVKTATIDRVRAVQIGR